MLISKICLSLKPKKASTPSPLQISASPAEAGRRDEKTSLQWKLTLMVALAIPIFLETLDYTVVATAQPHVASVFHRLDLQSYIGTSYLLSSTVFLPLFASFADIYGRHSTLQISLFFFIAGSAICTASQTMAMMLAGRGVAGVGAAGMIAVVRIILSDSKSLNDNNWQVAMLLVLYSIAYSVGPVIGGLLVQVSFRWVFAINLPCCVVSMILCFFLLRHKTKPGIPPRRLPDPNNNKETALQKLLRVDWVGATIFIGGGICLLLALNWGSSQAWNSARVIICFVIGAALFGTCIGWEYLLERQAESPSPSSFRILWAEPMLPLAVFRSYDVCSVQLAAFVSGMVMLVMFYFVAIFMVVVNGLSATRSGVQLLYFAPGIGAGTLGGTLMIKHLRQPKYPIILGSVVIPVALGLVSMGVSESKENLVDGFMVMAGVGIGLSAGALQVHARFSQPNDRVAVVTALNLFFRSLGGTVGLAQCAAVMNARVTSYLTSLIKSGALSSSSALTLASASAQGLSSVQSIDDLPPEVQALVRDAFRSGIRWCFISLVPWCAVSFFLTLFLSNIEDSDLKLDDKKATENGEETLEPKVDGVEETDGVEEINVEGETNDDARQVKQ